MVGIGPSGSGRRDMSERQQARRLHVMFPDRGHHTGVYVLPEATITPPAYQDSPVVSDYFASCEEKRLESRGNWEPRRGLP